MLEKFWTGFFSFVLTWFPPQSLNLSPPVSSLLVRLVKYSYSWAPLLIFCIQISGGQSPGICISCMLPKYENHSPKTEAIKGLFYDPFSWWFVLYRQEKKNKTFMLLIRLKNVLVTTMSVNHMNIIWPSYTWVCLEFKCISTLFLRLNISNESFGFPSLNKAPFI